MPVRGGDGLTAVRPMAQSGGPGAAVWTAALTMLLNVHVTQRLQNVLTRSASRPSVCCSQPYGTAIAIPSSTASCGDTNASRSPSEGVPCTFGVTR